MSRTPLHRRARIRLRPPIVALAALALICLGAVPATAAAQKPAFSHNQVVVSPTPGSMTAEARTQISFLGLARSAIGKVTVTGSRSGPHAGRLEAYSTGTGASFVPSKPFLAGEVVTVVTSLDIVGAPSGTFSFTVATPVDPGPDTPIAAVNPKAPGITHFSTEPNLEAPVVSVAGEAASLGGEDLFLAPKGNTGAAGPMIMSPSGRLIYFNKLSNIVAMDAAEQTYDGRPVLTWWQGHVLDGHGVGEDVIMNESYREVAIVRGGNGLSADLHDFVLTPQGTAFITTYAPIRWNLSAAGGNSNGPVWDGVVQEIDVKTGLVMFEWHSLDHLPLSLTQFRASGATQAVPFDWFHINSLEQLPGNQLLISSRDTSSVYDISIGEGGTVLWTLGGKDNQFHLGPGAQFNYQHDVKLVGSNLLTMFDNEYAPNPSRALELSLNLTTKTATVVHAFTHTPLLQDYTLGDTEVLPDANTLVSWGTSPKATVVAPNGRTLLQIGMPGDDNTYRTLAAAWIGSPTAPPAVTATANGSVDDVAMSWNGATAVTAWRVLSGDSPTTLRSVAVTRATNFESTSIIPAAPYVAVEALGAGKVTLRASATIHVSSA